MTWAIIDFEDYVLNSVILFRSKKSLQRYIEREYGDPLEDTIQINWKTGEVLRKINGRINTDEPLAVFEKKVILK